jgi:hypothetical protein
LGNPKKPLLKKNQLTYPYTTMKHEFKFIRIKDNEKVILIKDEALLCLDIIDLHEDDAAKLRTELKAGKSTFGMKKSATFEITGDLEKNEAGDFWEGNITKMVIK